MCIRDSYTAKSVAVLNTTLLEAKAVMEDCLLYTSVYVDDWSLQISSDLKSLSVENGALKAEYNADYQGEMKSSDFDISYTSSLEPEVAKKLDITSETVNGKTLTMNFAEIAKQPMKQTITVTATYKPSKQPMVVDFDVDASGEELVEANLTGITAENGSVQRIWIKYQQ